MTNVGRLLRAAIQEERQKIAADLAAGSAKDWAEYRHLVGVMQGFEIVVSLLDVVEENL